MRISNMIELIGKISSNAITANQERCVLVRNRNADCLRCAEACVSGCISYGENELIVNPLVCIGCGTCATLCPTAALEVKKPRRPRATRSLRKSCGSRRGYDGHLVRPHG